ncbi:MAG TPA: hypothetical protein VIX80_03160, partial [Candidatus Kapabacteria bacterium]
MSSATHTSPKLFDKELVGVSLKESFRKLSPRLMVKNPVMFTVEVGTAIMAVVTIMLAINPDPVQGSV